MGPEISSKKLVCQESGVGNPGAKKLGAKNLEARILRARKLGLGTREKLKLIQGS